MIHTINIETVHAFLMNELEGVVSKNTWGEASYFYNPGNVFEHGAYFSTIKEQDGENDRGSQLNRDRVWRLNIGISRSRFETLFGRPPSRPGKGQTIEGPWDFKTKDEIMPHPVYGWMSWIAVLCPSEQTFDECKLLIADAHQRAVGKFEKRLKAR